MPRSQPDALTLLAVAIDYLDTAIYPKLSGPERFHARVAINVLRIVQREFSLGPSLDREESAELRALLGSETGSEPSLDTLITQIETGRRSLDDPALQEFLRRSLGRALRVNNPRWPDDNREKAPARQSHIAPSDNTKNTPETP